MFTYCKLCSQVLWSGLEVMAKMVRHLVNPICYVAHKTTTPCSYCLCFVFFFWFLNYLTLGRLKSNDVAPRVGCSCFQILDQRNVLPYTRDILSRPTHFACLHDDMNVSSVVTMDHAIDAYSIWKCFMQFGCNLAPLILIIFAGYM